MGKISLNIRLTSKQRKMFKALSQGDYREVLFYGGGRAGKTFLTLFWLITEAVLYGANSLIARRTFESLKSGMVNQTLPAVLKAIAKLNGYKRYDDMIMDNGRPFCEWKARDNSLVFFNDAYIKFTGLYNRSSSLDAAFDGLLSVEWGNIFVDEASEVDDRPINMLRSRLAQKTGRVNKMLFALNPGLNRHWTYIRFFKHETADGLALSKDLVDSFLVMHFVPSDNKENISEDYERNFEGVSSLYKKRFLQGEYYSEAEGEIFKKITWSDSNEETKFPNADEWDALLVYTDPSAKESSKNDYKASVLLGRARNRIWFIDSLAVQGTSLQMMENIHELYVNSPVPQITNIWMERKQLPLDFKTTFEQFQQQHGWVCPLRWDTRVMGNKFTMIESILEPLFASERFIFNSKLKNTDRGELAIYQFISFSRNSSPDRKDDIPDACAKGVSLLNTMSTISRASSSPIMVAPRPKRFIL